MNTNHTYENMNHLDKSDVMHEMTKKLDKDRYTEILDHSIESGQIIVVDTISEIVTLYKIESYKSIVTNDYIHNIYKSVNTKGATIEQLLSIYNQGIKDNTDWGY